MRCVFFFIVDNMKVWYLEYVIVIIIFEFCFDKFIDIDMF